MVVTIAGAFDDIAADEMAELAAVVVASAFLGVSLVIWMLFGLLAAWILRFRPADQAERPPVGACVAFLVNMAATVPVYVWVRHAAM